MHISKHKISDSCHELRIVWPGRHGRQVKRRFESSKKLEDFKIKFMKLEALDPKFAERFVEGEDYEALFEEYKTPEEQKAHAAAAKFGDEKTYWFNHRLPDFSPGWKATVEGYWKELKDDLETRPTTKVTSEFLDDLVAKLRAKGNSQKTINSKIGWVQSVMNFSFDRKRISVNPVARYKKRKPPKAKIEFWEREDALDFLKFASDRYPMGSKNRWRFVVYTVALHTGLRGGELWALRPRCLRRSFSKIHIEEQFDVKAKEFRTTKSREGREVPLNAGVLLELDALISDLNLSRNDLFFSTEGKPVDHDNFGRIFEADQLAWKGPRIKFHALRHTAATLMLSSGVDVKTVKEILGHSSLETTMRYVHLLSTSVSDAAVKHSLEISTEKNIESSASNEPKKAAGTASSEPKQASRRLRIV